MTGYVERSLGDGERLIARAHFHWLYTLKALLALIVPLIVLVVILIYGRDIAEGWLALFGLMLLAAGVLVCLRLLIRQWTTEIAVTSHRFVEKYGFIALRTNEIALANIEGVRLFQGLWGRLWGYGHLRIEGTGVDAVEIPTIADPIGFRRAIETAKSSK